MFDRENVLSFLRQNIVPIILGSLGISLVVIGLFQIITKREPATNLVLEKSSSQKNQIVVDLEGALINPGVYKLDGDSRMVDALAAAGGLSESADRVWVEKNINLAKKVTDGLKIYIPRDGEVVQQTQTQAENNTSEIGLININSASNTDLESLAGVGSVTAQKIIEGRPYGSVDELLSKKIVGNATFEKIKTSISTQ